jgi:hypothetical protein
MPDCRQLSMTNLSLANTAKFVSAKVCPKTPYPVTLGCAISNIMRDSEGRITVPASECVVYIADEDILEKAGWSYNILMRHERAHCHGWPLKTNEPGILPRYEVPERGQWPSDLIAKARAEAENLRNVANASKQQTTSTQTKDKIYKYVGRDADGIARAWGSDATLEGAREQCLQQAIKYVQTRPDTGPLDKWIFEMKQ